MDNIEKYFNYFLKREVVFSVDNKIIKEGKLILFNQKDYYIIFYIKNGNGEQKKYEIPYPFNIKKEGNYLKISYKLEDISKNDSELFYRLMSLNQKYNSRFYNSTITMFEKNALDLTVVK
jgi:hypothetical protein